MRVKKVWLGVLAVLCCVSSASCAKGLEMSAEELVSNARQYEGRTVSAVGCILAGRHGATFFPCSSRVRGVQIQVESKFEATKSGQEFMKALYSAWPPNSSRVIPAAITGTVKDCKNECVISIEIFVETKGAD